MTIEEIVIFMISCFISSFTTILNCLARKLKSLRKHHVINTNYSEVFPENSK